jgi:adenosine deaminase CECR1
LIAIEFSNMGFLDVPASFNFATDVVDKWAAHTPPLTAMLWSDGKKGPPKKFTYEYFSTRSHHAAHLLTRLGAKKGDRMIILLPRVPAWYVIYRVSIVGIPPSI